MTNTSASGTKADWMIGHWRAQTPMMDGPRHGRGPQIIRFDLLLASSSSTFDCAWCWMVQYEVDWLPAGLVNSSVLTLGFPKMTSLRSHILPIRPLSKALPFARQCASIDTSKFEFSTDSSACAAQYGKALWTGKRRACTTMLAPVVVARQTCQ